MRRGLMVALVAAMMLVACTAQADFYGSLRYAGELNLKEFAFGTQSGSFGAEVGVGYTSVTITDMENLADELKDVEPTGSLMSFSGAVFFQIAGDERYGFDIGGRAQYMTLSGEVSLPDDLLGEEVEVDASLTGLSFGPLVRGRWFLVEDSIALGPEVYFKYSTYSTNLKLTVDDEEFDGDGPGATIMGLEYSLRMDFYF